MSSDNRVVVLSQESEEDLLVDIWHFGANEWSPEQADRHLRDLDDMFERLRENPKLGHKRDELIADQLSLRTAASHLLSSVTERDKCRARSARKVRYNNVLPLIGRLHPP